MCICKSLVAVMRGLALQGSQPESLGIGSRSDLVCTRMAWKAVGSGKGGGEKQCSVISAFVYLHDTSPIRYTCKSVSFAWASYLQEITMSKCQQAAMGKP